MTDAAEKIAARLTVLWQTSRPLILERIAALRAACNDLASNPSDAEARTRGREAAHKLSGILGTFGLPQGSEIASEMEEILKAESALTAEDRATLESQLADLDAVIASKPAN